MRMNVTVILATHNRVHGLPGTLHELAASRVPNSVEWEVVVVDNNSTDGTREVVEDFCGRFPGRFRYVFEPRPGKSYALNTGVREAKGAVLAFMDDDVRVDASWLANLTAPLACTKWSGAGGRTLLAEPFTPPNWMSGHGSHSLLGILAAVFDLGPEQHQLDQPPYGANMAFRREMFVKYGLFRTDLGPSPDRDVPRPNEDTEFGRRLMAAGELLLYQPSAVAYHPVQKNRVQRSYFLAWHFDYGRAMVREWVPGPNIVGIPRRYFTWLKLLGVSLPWEALRWIITIKPQRRFWRQCWIWTTAGQITEIYGQWLGRNGRRGSSNRRRSEPAFPKLSA
jgi:glucosyl-dolichyl phosphate glucuronosyltransferase